MSAAAALLDTMLGAGGGHDVWTAVTLTGAFAFMTGTLALRPATKLARPPQTFQEFWRYYLHEHTHPATRALHVFGNGAAALTAAALAAVAVTGPPVPRGLWLLPVVLGYLPGWYSHLFIERNRPAWFRAPVWGLMADCKLIACSLTGTIGAELRAAGVRGPRPPPPRLQLPDPEEWARLPQEERVRIVRTSGAAAGSGGRQRYRGAAPLLSRVRAALVLGRPRTCVPGLLTCALGAHYSGCRDPVKLVLGAVLGLLIGFIANLHNAYTDLEEDAHNLPGRGLMLLCLGYGSIPTQILCIGVFMVAGAALIGPELFTFMALAQMGINQYSAPPYRAKARPVAGLWVFAQAVVFPYIFGLFLTPRRMFYVGLPHYLQHPSSWREQPQLDAWRAFIMLWWLTLWFMAKGMVKNLPDYYGDKAAGVLTSATCFSSYRAAAVASLSCVTASIALLAGHVVAGLERPTLLVALAWLVPIVANSLKMLRAPDSGVANKLLATDMILSSGFIGTVLCLIAPAWLTVPTLACGAAIFLGVDLLGIDSRAGRGTAAAVAISDGKQKC